MKETLLEGIECLVGDVHTATDVQLLQVQAGLSETTQCCNVEWDMEHQTFYQSDSDLSSHLTAISNCLACFSHQTL